MSIKDIAAIKSLVRYGQFYIGPTRPKTIMNWSNFNIGDSTCLLTHPQLHVTQVSSGESQVTMIGYLLDPDNPEHSDEIILRSLAEKKTFFSRSF
jgi:hypothetical protein